MSIINQNDLTNKSHVLALNEVENRKVVEHNDLISSVAKMDKIPLKIFELAVSCIDTENPPKDNTIYLSKSELFSFFDVSDNGKHTRFKEAIEKMQKQAFFEIKEISDTKKGYKMKSIVPIPYVEWNSYNDKVILQFQSQIMPYLIDLKSNFTQYALSDIMELNSKYSIIIYKWLCMYYNQYEHYNAKGGRRSVQLEDYRNPSITIKDLRVLTDTVTDYKKFYDFEKRVLKTATLEINNHTHFNVVYEKIKKGRTIDSIQFFITKKKVAKNENYKQEQQDIAYIQGKQKKEEEQQRLFTQAMQSEYTTLLAENALIGFRDVQNITLMADLQRLVYPYYKELEELKGINGLKQHLSYVAMKQEDYSKKNTPLYLKKAVTSYISSLKFKNSK
ncbi:RepB family plasmid replication initiator protein [Lactococcus garvieae]|uniref:RepB n=1 Tax=Lactococcus garvieae DCC43 TaxID=1231377 RepID=K2PT44_9LACT|nr:RepB family plasmid replication initiator protein [Lactococcus garvieae]EKF50631.1 RepB [Lactococcus garvieae DCC43]